MGAVTPQPETCDGIDEDCNGVIDDTQAVLNLLHNIVLDIDYSGSMCPYIYAVANALESYIAQFEGNPRYSFSLVDMTAPPPAYVALQRDFDDLLVIRQMLLAMASNCGGNPWEASLDSLYMICDLQDNSLGLSWDDDSNKIIFGFSDEAEQSQILGVNYIDVQEKCAENGVIVYFWGHTFSRFGEIATYTGGRFFQISTDWIDIFTDLNDVLIDMCIDDEDY